MRRFSNTLTKTSGKVSSVLWSIYSKNGKKLKIWKIKSQLMFNKTTFLMMKKLILKTAMIMTVLLMTVKRTLTMKGEKRRKNKTKKINKKSWQNLNGHMTISSIFLWRMFLLGSLFNNSTETQCTRYVNKPCLNLAVSRQYKTGSLSQFTHLLSFPVRTVSMWIQLQENVWYVNVSWVVYKNLSIRCGRWCRNKEETLTAIVVTDWRKDSLRNATAVESTFTKSILFNGYLTPKEQINNGSLSIRFFNLWESIKTSDFVNIYKSFYVVVEYYC